MKKISAIILADNRENIIEGCLKSLEWVDEIILVNLGSKDKTLVIAKKYECRIIRGGKEYNFSQWRNQGAKAAKGEWLLYIDSDERITSELKKEILSTINNPQHQSVRGRQQLTISAYYLPRKNYFVGKEFKTTYPDYQLRLIKKKALIKWQGKIHETPDVRGKIGKLKNPLVHLSHRSLDLCLENTLKWSWLEAENRFKAGHSRMNSLRFLRIILTGFWDQFVRKKIWREETEGVIEGIYQVFSLFFTYVRLWEMQRGESLEKSYREIDKKTLSTKS